VDIKKRFGQELKQMVTRHEPISMIGRYAHNLYYEHMSEINNIAGFRKLLIQLGTMETGPEFARSYEELDQIADRLIAGEDVKLYP
jgi:hypothetical protein